jgi:hypothetical protein
MGRRSQFALAGYAAVGLAAIVLLTERQFRRGAAGHVITTDEAVKKLVLRTVMRPIFDARSTSKPDTCEGAFVSVVIKPKAVTSKNDASKTVLHVFTIVSGALTDLESKRDSCFNVLHPVLQSNPVLELPPDAPNFPSEQLRMVKFTITTPGLTPGH